MEMSSSARVNFYIFLFNISEYMFTRLNNVSVMWAKVCCCLQLSSTLFLFEHKSCNHTQLSFLPSQEEIKHTKDRQFILIGGRFCEPLFCAEEIIIPCHSYDYYHDTIFIINRKLYISVMIKHMCIYLQN